MMRFLSIALFLLAASACIADVPQTTTLQVVPQMNGRPYVGAAIMKLAVVDSSGNTLWSNDGTTSGEPVAGINVPAHAVGTPVSITLGDATLKMPPFDASAFPADASMRVWFAAAGRATEELLPRLRLGSVPYAAQAESAIKAASLGGQEASAFARSPFTCDSGSGLPTGFAMSLNIDGSASGAQLSGPGVDAQVDVVEYKDPEDETTRYRPGNNKTTRITIKRPVWAVTNGADWFKWTGDAATGQSTGRRLDLALSDGSGAPVVQGSALGAVPVSDGIILSDDGTAMEQMTMSCTDLSWSLISQPQGSKPALNLQRGLPSAGGSISVAVDGVEMPYVIFAGKKGYDYYKARTSDPDLILAADQGTGVSEAGQTISLRANPTEGSFFLDWFKTIVDGNVQRKSISIIFHNDAGEETMRYNFHECWPCRWSIPEVTGKASAHAVESIDIVTETVDRSQPGTPAKP